MDKERCYVVKVCGDIFDEGKDTAVVLSHGFLGSRQFLRGHCTQAQAAQTLNCSYVIRAQVLICLAADIRRRQTLLEFPYRRSQAKGRPQFFQSVGRIADVFRLPYHRMKATSWRVAVALARLASLLCACLRAHGSRENSSFAILFCSFA